MNMKKEPIFIAFSTQKGGVGKTTLTVLVASYLHYLEGYRVAVIDCDYPQHSIVEMRKRDIDLIVKEEYYKSLAHKQFTKLRRNAYPVLEASAVDGINIAQQLISQSEEQFDIVFFDLPGTMNSQGVVRTIAQMDYVFAPVSADRVVLESTLQFAITISANLIATGKSKIKKLHLIWNMVDGREKSDLYRIYETIISELGLSILKTFIPDAKRFRREQHNSAKPIFRSTLFPADKSEIKVSRLKDLVDEICSSIKKDRT